MPVLQIQMVLNEPTAGDMEEALTKMPCDLDGALRETLDRIDKQPKGCRRLAMAILMWISHAFRPLKVNELVEALSIRPGQSSINPKYFPSPKLILDCCFGLVTIDEESSTIRLVHFAVEEYFRSKRDEIFHGGTTEIAEACLIYLSFDAFGSGPCEHESQIRSFIAEYAFLGYSTFYWGDHVRNSQNERIENMAFDLIRFIPVLAFAQQISRYSSGYRRKYWKKKEAITQTALHMASRFGLERTVRHLLDLELYPVDVPTHIGTTPLMYAACHGHISVMRILLDANADPYKESWYGTSLHIAAERGNCDSIVQLLTAGIDVNIKDSHGRTALECALDMGRSTAMLLLLDRGANIVSSDLSSMLSEIIGLMMRSERKDLMRKLDQQIVDAITRLGEGHTSLLGWAVCSDKLEVLRFLISHGVNVNSQDPSGQTPLHFATACSSTRNMRVLLEHGAEVDAQDKNGLTPLFYALRFPSTERAEVLLKSGASLHVQDRYGWTPIQVAAACGTTQTLQVLGEYSADVEGPRSGSIATQSPGPKES